MSDFISRQYNTPHTCERGGRANVIHKERDGQKYSDSFHLNHTCVFLSMPEEETKKSSGQRWKE